MCGFSFRKGERVMYLWQDLRAQRGLTRAELARVIGVSEPTMEAYERGKRVPTVGEMYAAARALGCTADRLCGHERTV